MKTRQPLFSIDPEVSQTPDSLCAGGCGKTWEEAGGGWMGFSTTGSAPFWSCDACFEQKQEQKFMAEQAKLPPHVQQLRLRVRELMTDLILDPDEVSSETTQELAELRRRLHAEYAKLGYWPDGKGPEPR